MKKFKIQSEVLRYPGHDGWHFALVGKPEAEKIKNRFGHLARGWGSLLVEVRVGKSLWRTSIFPDKKEGVYLLPLKASVRRAEGIMADEIITFSIEILA